jgi:hypothetical protein
MCVVKSKVLQASKSAMTVVKSKAPQASKPKKVTNDIRDMLKARVTDEVDETPQPPKSQNSRKSISQSQTDYASMKPVSLQ